ncbi:MAG: hypothetical protein AUI36_43245 [Cyanobacteria bacterium 13_1_40CM_2_61_4]|nr:MAG: hypothetical protein AUI36_43245 [Cyanobacteria bacterium 13_1_40CM_2_61_4]
MPYAVKVAQVIRALGRPNARARGLRLEREAGPRLYELVEETAHEVGLRSPRAIWLTMTFESRVVAAGREHDLLLGLPLLDAVSAEELRMLVAVALLRSFGGDRRTSAAYGAAMRWAEVLVPAVERPAAPGANVAALVAAGWVWLLDLEHVAELRERDAREAASKLTSLGEVESALARAAMCESYVDDVFWLALIARHSGNVEPPDAITQLRRAAHGPMPADEWERRWNRARAELKLITDTLPRQDQHETRASALVDAASVFTRAFDDTWRATNALNWAALHHGVGTQTARLEELDLLASTRPLAQAEAWQRLLLRKAREGTPAVLEELRAWAVEHPTDAAGLFEAGRGLLAQQDASGIPFVERAVALDERYGIDGNALIAAYLRANARETEATDYRNRSEESAKDLEKGLKARTTVAKDVTVSAHGLSADQVEVIAQNLRKFRGVKAATVARGEPSILPTIPLVLIGVRWRRSAFWFTIESPHDVLNRIAAVALPLQVVAVDMSKVAAMRQPPAEEIYRVARVAWRVRAVGWGRKAQLVLVASGIFLIVVVGVINRDCFPDCWDATAIFLLTPVIVAVNALLLAGAPYTSARRAIAFVASAFFAGMFFFGGAFALLFPVALIGLMRAPTSVRPMMWALGMSVPAFALGWLVTTV